MRQVSRLVLRARSAPRTKPQPLWLRPAQLGMAAVAAVAAIGIGLKVLQDLGILADAQQWSEARLLEATGRTGLVVRKVHALGRDRTAERDVAQILERLRGAVILAVDSGLIKERLESLPWVRSATVVRQFPDTLLARLEEHQPLAIWLHEGRRRLIGQDGEIIPVSAVGRDRRLPVLSGAGAPARARDLFRMIETEPTLAPRLTQATLIGGRRWNVWLDHRIEVRLPESEAEEAWHFLAARQRETGLLGRAIEAVDLRQSGWLVLRLMDETGPMASGRGV
jgi:cell division protein FtsQ